MLYQSIPSDKAQGVPTAGSLATFEKVKSDFVVTPLFAWWQEEEGSTLY